MKLPVIIVHGGATVFKSEHHASILEAVEHAARRGMCAMEKGGSSVDAVEAAIWTLEETSLFTAGLGASKNEFGTVEVDAMVMDGSRLESGAVLAARDVIHPVSVARYVLERTPIMQVAGAGANRLYEKMITEGYRVEIAERRSDIGPLAKECDTVGAVAVDETGRVCSGSSTSGWPGKVEGRVGDSAIIGAGVYASDVAGASCTGKGEQILRIVMGRMAVYHVEQGLSVAEAARLAVSELRQKTSGEAGLIMADRKGAVAVDYDTPHLPVAVIGGDFDELYSSMTPRI
ncbi:MAG: isoaspartyl peptidase/L-asparaginase [Candidatus Thorarchaeota archaeon]